MELRPEDELLIIFSRLELTTTHKNRINKILSVGIDWGYFILNCQCHKILSLVYYHLTNEKLINQIQNRLFKLLKTNYIYTARKYELYREEFTRLTELFNSENVNYLVIKGFPLIDKVYRKKCPYIREFKDIDFVVNKDEISKVKKLLLKHNYVQGEFNKYTQSVDKSSREDLLSWQMYSHQLQSFVKEIDFDELAGNRNTIEVEIGHTIFDGGSNKPQIETEELLKSKQELPLSNQNHYYCLSNEYFIIQLCYHLFKDIHYDFHKETLQDLTLQKFSDIHEFITEYESKINWHSVLKIINENGLFNAVYFALYFTEKIYNNQTISKYLSMFTQSDENINNFISDYNKYFEKTFFRSDFNVKVFA